MKWRRQAKSRSREFIHTRVHRLTIEAEHDEERDYLCWLSRQGISGELHYQYILEMAKKPDALAGLSEEDISIARRVYAAECEGLKWLVETCKTWETLARIRPINVGRLFTLVTEQAEEIARARNRIQVLQNARLDDLGVFERIAASLGMKSFCCGAETMELELRAKHVGAELESLRSEADRAVEVIKQHLYFLKLAHGPNDEDVTDQIELLDEILAELKG